MQFLVAVLVSAMMVFVAQAAVQGNRTVLNEEQQARVNRINAECKLVSGIDQSWIDRARNGDFEDNPAMKKHALCFSKKSGFQDENGFINENFLKDRLSKVISDNDTVQSIMTKCTTAQGTPELTAYHMLVCLHQTVPIGTVYVR